MTMDRPKRSAAKPAMVGETKPPTSSPMPMIMPRAVAMTSRGTVSAGMVAMNRVKQPRPV